MNTFDFQMFLLSPRNSIEAFLALLESGKVTHMITPDGHPPIANTILAKRTSMKRYDFPSLDFFLDAEPAPVVGYYKSWEEARFDPWIWLHTSGSTGIPKIIPIKQGYTTTVDAFNSMPFNEQADRLGNRRFFLPFPPSHMAGIIMSTSSAMYTDATVIFPPIAPLNAELIDKVHTKANVEFSMIPPALITDLTNEPNYLENLRKLKGLNFAGGPLPNATGDFVKKYTTLYNTIGATEYGILPFKKKEPDDWAWLSFEETYAGLDMRKQESEDLYEMVIVKDARLDLFQAIFITFPDITEYHTKDLFVKHPSKPNLWRYHGRLDDVIVLSNGEKLVPVSMEGSISTCPELLGCLVFGQGQFQPGVLLESRIPTTTRKEKSALLDTVWPFVDRANQAMSRHGRITKELIVFTHPDRPLPRAGKGTIQRAAANKLYADDIDNVYKEIEAGKQVENSIDASFQHTLTKTLMSFIHNELDLPGLDAHSDFFTAGMDSLMTITLVREINASLAGKINIKTNTVYENASVQQLAEYLWFQCKSHSKGLIDYDDDDGYDSDDDHETWEKMQEIYEEVRKDLPINQPERSSWWTLFWSSKNNKVVMPPDGGTMAWLQVFGCFLIQFNNWGIVNSWGPFQEYYQQSLLTSTSPESIAWIGTLQGALLLIVGVISGPLFDMGFFKVLLLIVTILLSLSFMMVSLATEFYQLLLAQGILIGVCLGMLYIPSIALINLYFTTRRGLALGLATSGGAIGGVIYPVVFRRVLESSGFGWATRSIGFLALATLLLAAIILQPVGPMKQPTRRLIDKHAFKEWPFISYMLAAFFIYLGVLVPFFLGSTYAVQKLSLDEDIAFYCIAILNAGQFFGRILPSIASDWIGPESLLLAASLSSMLLAFVWIAVHNLGGYIAFLIFYGITSGAVSTLSAAVLPYICPNLSTVGTRFGMVYSVAGLGVLASNPVATKLISVGASVDYLGSQLWTGLTIAIGAAFYALGTYFEARKRRLEAEAWGSKKKYVLRNRRRQNTKSMKRQRTNSEKTLA